MRRARWASRSASLCLISHAGPAQAAPIAEHVPSADDRYTLADGCFALRSQQNGQLRRQGRRRPTRRRRRRAAAAEPFRMQATDLGSYLFYGQAEDFMARNALTNAVDARRHPQRQLRLDRRPRTAAPSGSRVVGTASWPSAPANALVTVAGGLRRARPASSSFELVDDSGCADYPEVEVNVTGPLPDRPGARDRQVNGTVETHMHGMAFEFLGTTVHCGRPWHRFGAPSALEGLRRTTGRNGCSAVARDRALGHHLPRHRRLADLRRLAAAQPLHPRAVLLQVARAILARRPARLGQPDGREPGALRALPAATPADPRTATRWTPSARRSQRIHELEDYIDAQWGGPGKGWYRIVETPEEARAVINDGKLAVIKGMEVSEPFDCRLMQPGDMPLCSEAQLDAGIDEIYDDLGIRQLEIVNKFDNALTGVAGDSGSTGTITNLGNFYSAGHLLGLRDLPAGPDDPAVNHDHSPTALSAQRRRADRRRPRPLRRHDRDHVPGLRPGAALQPARPHRPRRARAPPDHEQGDALRPRPHERHRSQPGARPGRGRGATRGS